MGKPKKKFTAVRVKGKVQRAATYQPGTDVVCVRGPIGAIDRIRATAKRKEVSISQLVCSKFPAPKAKRPPVVETVAEGITP